MVAVNSERLTLCCEPVISTSETVTVLLFIPPTIEAAKASNSNF